MAAVVAFQVQQILAQIKRYLASPSGFYMKINDLEVQVQCIKDPPEADGSLSLDHDIVLKVVQLASNPDVLCVPCSTGDVLISEKLAIYYGGFSLETGSFSARQGHVSSITNSKGIRTFTVIGSELSKCPGSPVFIYDEVNKVLNLAGIILSQEQESADGSCQAIHIDMIIKDERVQKFLIVQKDVEDIDRGGKVIVYNGNFTGIEEGNRGPGPRSISINGGNVSVVYRLTFVGGSGIPASPHDDKNYNKNKNHRPFYQSALDAFVGEYQNGNQPLPSSFIFDFKGTEYTAKQ